MKENISYCCSSPSDILQKIDDLLAEKNGHPTLPLVEISHSNQVESMILLFMCMSIYIYIYIER
jgi:hypothetical protein